MTALLALALAVVVALVGVSAIADETLAPGARDAARRIAAERERREQAAREAIEQRARQQAEILRQLRRPGVPPAIVGVGSDERWVG